MIRPLHLVLGLALGLLACRPPEAPSVLLVTFDTTRADRLGAYGYEAAHTPVIDRLAAQGVVYDHAIAPAPITLPSHATLLTGVTPNAHGVRDNGQFALSNDATLISEILAPAGWRTAAFVGSYVLDARFGLDQGFETYRGPTLDPGSSAVGAARPAARVVDDALAWLASVEVGERFFLWVHFYDPHIPLNAPEPWASRVPDAYDAEIAYADAELGRLLDALHANGQDEALVTLLTSDHGESLGEHREDTHGIFVYQSTLHVPFIISGPPLSGAAGQRVAETISLADVAPTVLALAGLDPGALPDASGEVLIDDSGQLAHVDALRSIYFESFLPFFTMRWHALRGVVVGHEKLVLGRSAELFDLAADPGEQHDRSAESPDRVRALRERLEAFEEASSGLGWGAAREPTPLEIAQLEALGYAGRAQSGHPLDPELPDPRSRMEEHDAFERANTAWSRSRVVERRAGRASLDAEREHYTRQVDALRAQARRELTPYEHGDNPILLDLIGKLDLKLGNPAGAAAALERAVALQSSTAATWYNLGLAYRSIDRGDDALRAFEEAQAIEPAHAPATIMVARQLAEAGEFESAREWLERARALVPPGHALESSLRGVEAHLPPR